MDAIIEKPKYTTGQVIDKYIQLRDYVEKEEKEFKARIKKYTDAMDKLEGDMLERLRAENQQSAKSSSGNICFRVTKTSVKIKDKTDWLTWIHDNWDEAPHMLTAHIAKDGVLEYLSREDKLPRGVDLNNILAVQFRKG